MLRSIFWKPYSHLIVVGDNAGWSIDEDAKDLKRFSEWLGTPSVIVRKTPLNVPQAVHYNSQFALTHNIFKSRHRISLDYYHGKPDQDESFRKCFEALKKNHEKISRIRVSTKEMGKLILSSGISEEKVMRIPIGIDTDRFLPQTDLRRKEAREKLGIPEGAFVIGSFQKDGVGWGEGDEPKLIKGPDVFLKVIEGLKNEIPNLYILLSGPSRGFVKNGLEKLNVPYHHEFLKDFRELPDLYDALDLYIVTSREEGGPKAILESMAKGVPLVTTEVGQAADIVSHKENAMMAPQEDVEKLVEYSLEITKNPLLREVLIKHGFHTAKENSLKTQIPLWKKYFTPLVEQGKEEISIFHEFHKPPYGGGNQFLIGLEKEFGSQGKKVVRNEVSKSTKFCLFNSYNFDFDKLRKLKNTYPVKMIHRVDGPISVYRGTDMEIDKEIWQMNHDLADKTIFQSDFSFRKHIELGLSFKNSTVIPNAADPKIFNRDNKASAPDGKRKVRIIATSWSKNNNKGADIYQWLDENLDFDKYEFTFLGNSPYEFKRAKHIEPQPSEEVAKILKEHDIYITASKNDPCSNALIEALSCGLPAVYLNSGGHPELVKNGGEKFTNEHDVMGAIEKVTTHYSEYQEKIEVLTLTEVAQRYLEFFNS